MPVRLQMRIVLIAVRSLPISHCAPLSRPRRPVRYRYLSDIYRAVQHRLYPLNGRSALFDLEGGLSTPHQGS